MPVYEFQCPTCEAVAEEFFHSSEKIVSSCPSCKTDMKRLFSLPAGRLDWGPGRHIEHCGDRTFHSQQEYKQYCKKHDLAPTGSRWV